MVIDDIQKLIDKDESVTLELKKTTGEPKDAMHTACAFLNTDGGWLVHSPIIPSLPTCCSRRRFLRVGAPVYIGSLMPARLRDYQVLCGRWTKV